MWAGHITAKIYRHYFIIGVLMYQSHLSLCALPGCFTSQPVLLLTPAGNKNFCDFGIMSKKFNVDAG
jgi:hypothetical protein